MIVLLIFFEVSYYPSYEIHVILTTVFMQHYCVLFLSLY